MKIIKFLTLSIITLFVFSCEKYEKQYSWAYPIAGDWKVNAYVDGTNVYGPFEIKSYNSSFGQDSIWFDDYDGNFWDMKYKVSADMTDNTFQTTGSVNQITGYPISIVVKDGKVINNDSIVFDIIFEDDPSTTYQIAGHRANKYDDYMQD